MSNKTIINGIDVSKCKWHTSLIMSCLEIPLEPSKCENDNNCYFKQQARAKEEIEEIKKYLGMSNKTIMQRLEELQEYRDKLSEENEELEKQLDKYKQTLDEIEEFYKQNHYCLESEYRWFSDEIQDIINKTKEERK